MSSAIIKAQKAPVIFLSGKMTGDARYHEKFFLAQCMLQRKGYIVINPAVLPTKLTYEQQMRICFTCIDVAEAICLLPDYLDSNGSSSEHGYAMAKGKTILHYEDIIHRPVNFEELLNDTAAEKV